MRPILLVPALSVGTLLTLGLVASLPRTTAEEPAAAHSQAAAKPATGTRESRPWLGARLTKPDEALAYHLRLGDDLGVLVIGVAPDSPAATMGLNRYDLVIAVDGKPVYTERALQRAVEAHRIGESLRLEVRRGEQARTISGELTARPAGMPDDGARPERRPGPGDMPGQGFRPDHDGQGFRPGHGGPGQDGREFPPGPGDRQPGGHGRPGGPGGFGPGMPMDRGMEQGPDFPPPPPMMDDRFEGER